MTPHDMEIEETGQPDVRTVRFRGKPTDIVLSPRAFQPLGVMATPREAALELRDRLLEQDLADVATWLALRHPGAEFILLAQMHYSQPAFVAEIAYVVVETEPQALRRSLRAEATRALSALGWHIAPRRADVYDAGQAPPFPAAHGRMAAFARVAAALSLVDAGAQYPRRRAAQCRRCRGTDVIRVVDGRRLRWGAAEQVWAPCDPWSATPASEPPGYTCRACGHRDAVFRYTDTGEPCDWLRGLFAGEVLSDAQAALVKRARCLELR
jgi:hypothetical protein